MKTVAKQIVALAAGAILLLGLPGQTAHAQLIMSGTATLATVGTAPTPIGTVANGTATGPEAITVTYSVTFTSGVYFYEYTVNNPTGNVILPVSGNNPYFLPAFTYAPNGNAGKPAVVNSFSVSFNTTVPGAYSPENALPQNNGVNGLLWTFGALSPGSSETLGFTSTLPPVLGNASAMGPNPPGPWSSFPLVNGQQVPVPATALIVSGTTLIEAGTATMAPNALNNGSSSIFLNYAVTANSIRSIFTYQYWFINPSAENGGVAQFFVFFDTTDNGLVPGSILGGNGSSSVASSDIFWTFVPSVAPGNISGTLSFEASSMPVMGNADGNGFVNGPFIWESASAPVPNVP